MSLSVAAEGSGARLALDVNPSGWAPLAATQRFASGLGATLVVAPSGAPSLGLAAHVGLPGAPAGRQAVHVQLSGSGTQLFLRPASGNDISLIPFAGLGSLSGIAEAALPFLLNKLADVPGTVGELVQTLGDGLMLRTGTPRKFDAQALHTWAVNPAGALQLAGPSLVSTGLSTIAEKLDDFIPDAITIGTTADALTARIDPVSVSWNPSTGIVTMTGDSVTVPGVNQVSFTLRLSANGIEEVSTTVGPSLISTGSVILQPFITVAGGRAPDRRRRVAVGMAADETRRFAARWLLDSNEFALIASDGELDEATDTDDAVQVSLRLVEIIAELVAAVALAKQAVTDLLDVPVGDSDVRGLLSGVILDGADPTKLIASPFDPNTILARIQQLFVNIADASPSVPAGDLRITFTREEDTNTIGLLVGLDGRYELLDGDVMLWLETENSWITDNPAGSGGVFVGFMPEPEGRSAAGIQAKSGYIWGWSPHRQEFWSLARLRNHTGIDSRCTHLA